MSSVARLVGYGYDRPSGDDEMPLDVHYAKVTEWLVSLCFAYSWSTDHLHFGSHTENVPV